MSQKRKSFKILESHDLIRTGDIVIDGNPFVEKSMAKFPSTHSDVGKRVADYLGTRSSYIMVRKLSGAADAVSDTLIKKALEKVVTENVKLKGEMKGFAAQIEYLCEFEIIGNIFWGKFNKRRWKSGIEDALQREIRGDWREACREAKAEMIKKEIKKRGQK